MRYKTTPENFEYFKDRCNFWQEFFGLISWKMYFSHKRTDVLASCHTNYTGRVATITLNTSWNIPVIKEQLNESAIHEVLEMMMSPLLVMAKSRVWEMEDYEKEHHSIIRTLERLFTAKTK